MSTAALFDASRESCSVASCTFAETLCIVSGWEMVGLWEMYALDSAGLAPVKTGEKWEASVVSGFGKQRLDMFVFLREDVW